MEKDTDAQQTQSSQQPQECHKRTVKQPQERKAKIKSLIDNNHHSCLLILCFVIDFFFLSLLFFDGRPQGQILVSILVLFFHFILYHTDTDTCTSLLPFLVHLLTPSLSHSSILFFPTNSQSLFLPHTTHSSKHGKLPLYQKTSIIINARAKN